MGATESFDAIIVGGGLAGLTAAAFGARAGARTLLLEGAPELGGRARTRDRGGFLFNQGPHALYLAGAGKRALETLGIDPAGGPPVLKGASAILGGVRHAFPGDPGSLISTQAFSASDKIGFASAYARIAAGYAPPAGDTLADALARLAPTPRVRAALAMFVRVATYCDAPGIADANSMFAQLRLAQAGVRYLDGGWRDMVAALAGVAARAGAQLTAEARVASIDADGAGWRVTCGDGRQTRGATLVLAVAPQEAAALVPGVTELADAARAAVPVRAACLDLGLTRAPDPAAAFALGLDAPLYFSMHSASARLAPADAALIHVSRYLGAGGADRDTRGDLEALADLMQPGWRALAVAEQYLPLAIVAHDLPQAARGGLAGRIPVAVRPSLFVAGDWVGPEGLLSDAAFSSGRAAGEACAAHARRHREVAGGGAHDAQAISSAHS